MMAHTPVSGSDTTCWMAQVRRSKKPATSGSRCALAWSEQDRGKRFIVHPSGVWGKEPDVSTNEISTSGGLGCEAAATRSLAVASDASAVSLASGLRHDADVGLRRLPALRVDLFRFLVRHRTGDDHVF